MDALDTKKLCHWFLSDIVLTAACKLLAAAPQTLISWKVVLLSAGMETSFQINPLNISSALE